MRKRMRGSFCKRGVAWVLAFMMCVSMPNISALAADLIGDGNKPEAVEEDQPAPAVLQAPVVSSPDKVVKNDGEADAAETEIKVTVAGDEDEIVPDNDNEKNNVDDALNSKDNDNENIVPDDNRKDNAESSKDSDAETEDEDVLDDNSVVSVAPSSDAASAPAAPVGDSPVLAPADSNGGVDSEDGFEIENNGAEETDSNIEAPENSEENPDRITIYVKAEEGLKPVNYAFSMQAEDVRVYTEIDEEGNVKENGATLTVKEVNGDEEEPSIPDEGYVGPDENGTYTKVDEATGTVCTWKMEEFFPDKIMGEFRLSL